MGDAGVAIDLTGRVALVTGAGGGIGEAVARRLGQAGARVAVNDLDADRAEHVSASLVADRVDAQPFPGDVTDEATVDGIVSGCQRAFGGLDVAVNNVGMLGGVGPRPVTDYDAVYIRRIIEQNLVATALCAAAEARAMTSGGGGVIVNVSSGETTRTAPLLGIYAAAKAAINHLSATMAHELGPAGIRVLAVAPGTTPTPTVAAALGDELLADIAASTPLQRACEPDDLARLVVFLASDLASHITGQFVLADAGAHLHPFRAATAGAAGTSSEAADG